VDDSEGACAKRRRVQSIAEEGAGSTLLMQGLALIAKVPLFANLAASEHPQLVGAFTSAEYGPGDVIVRQGDPGREFLIVDGGRAELTMLGPAHWAVTEPVRVGVLSSGEHAGEAGLLHGRPWNATMRALDKVRVWTLERADFQRLGLRHKLRFERRLAVHEGTEAESELQPEEPRSALLTEAERAFLRRALLANPGLGPLVRHLSEDELDRIMSSGHRRRVAEGEEVLRQGDVKVDFFYIIQEGSFLAIRNRELVERLNPGGSFGELALLYRAPRYSTVRASSDATLWQVQRQAFRSVERAQLRRKLEDFAVLLRRVELLQGTSEAEIQQLADALVEVSFKRGEQILREGEVGRSFFILHQGTVNVEVSGREPTRLVADSERGPEFFGELALLQELPRWWTAQWRTGTVVVASKTAVALVLDREVFLRVVRQRAAAAAALPAESGATRLYRRDQLEEVGLLGCGRFAKVSLVRCRETGHTFAMKSLLKARVLEHKQQQNVTMEKTILKTTRSPFLIRLVATFSSERHLEFLLEAALGGDLLTAYGRHDFYGSAEHARFYVACVLRGLEHLHERHIIYRDLKMENVLLDAQGYAKLTDFGLAKFVIGHTYTRCGTPDFMAPEMIKGAGHTSAVDWWALGVLAYALMEGALPFDAPQSCMIFWKVERGIEFARFTDESAPWVGLVKDLCKQEPSERLPVRAGGARGVWEHLWFAGSGFNMAALDQRALPAPYKPPISGPGDLQNFDPDAQDAPQEGKPYVDPGNGWDADFEDTLGPASLE